MTQLQINLYSKLISWLESFSKPCFYKQNFGFACPGCGFQRSIILTLKGDFLESIKMYPALYPILFFIIILALHIKFRFKNGGKIIKILFFMNIFIMIVSYIIKLKYFPQYH